MDSLQAAFLTTMMMIRRSIARPISMLVYDMQSKLVEGSGKLAPSK